MDASHIAEFKALLEGERQRLERELAAFTRKDSKMRDDWDTVFPTPASLGAPSAHTSQEEQADLREEFETNLAQEQSLELRLREVTRALERIAGNTFGTCRKCGQPIAEERLRANPAAEYDIEHQPRE